MKRTKKKSRSRTVAKKIPIKRTRSRKIKLIYTGGYVRFLKATHKLDLDERAQNAMLGLVFPVLSRENKHVKEWIERYEEFSDIEFEGYLTDIPSVVNSLIEKDMPRTALIIGQSFQKLLWFPPESCAEVKKEQLN